MRHNPISLAILITVAGCGTSGQHALTNAPPHPAKASGHGAPVGAVGDDSFNLPRLGTFTARCPAPGPYSIRFVADRKHATDRLKVRVAGRLVKDVERDPGEALSLDVPVKSRTVGPDRISQTPPVVWSIVQDTEPHTLRGTARLVLANTDDGRPPSCRFEQLRTSLVTESHSGP